MKWIFISIGSLIVVIAAVFLILEKVGEGIGDDGT